MSRPTTIALLLLVSAAVSAQRSSGPHPDDLIPKVPFHAGRGLTSHLTGNGKVVEVVKQSAPPFAIYPEGLSELEAFTRMADAVAVVQVVDKRCALTPDGDWAHTTVSAQAKEALKSTEVLPLDVGRTISFPEDGGEFEVEGGKVIASVSWARPTQRGQRYLVFFHLLKDGTIASFGPSGTFAIEGSRLVRQTKRPRNDELEQQDVMELFEQIRALGFLPKVVPW